MKKTFILSLICIWVAGTALHFTYDFLGQDNTVALFAPINESVWEHYKLLVFPFTAAIIYLGLKTNASWQAMGSGLVTGLVVGAFVMFGIFYIYTSAFGSGPVLFMDLGSFFISTALALWVGTTMLKLNVPTLVGALCWGAALVIITTVWCFTYYPPRYPIFREWQK